MNGGLRVHESKKEYSLGYPLITVITVVFNGAKTLEQTILSVINQTYKNIEYIIIDGNSTDGTLDIIKKYEDRIDYWQSEPDKGIYDAMNKGIDLGSGEWVNFMNSGDSFFDSQVLEKIFCSVSGDYDVIYGNCNQIFEFGEKIVKGRELTASSYHMTFNHQSCFTKLKRLCDYHYDIDYRICADYDFYKKLINNNCSFKYVDIPVSNFECTDGISSKNPLTMYKELLRINKVSHEWIYVFLFSLKRTLKIVIKKIIPYGLLNKYRQRKYLK